MTTPSTQRAPVSPDIKRDIQSSELNGLIEMFILDVAGIVDVTGTVMTDPPLHFHAGTNEFEQDLIWQGVRYIALPVEADGFDVSSKGTLPRPHIRLANVAHGVAGLFNPAVLRANDLIGAKITRKRTFAKYLDAANFINGNPTADPYKELPDDVFYVEQKVSETRHLIEWELVSRFDLQGKLLPGRQVSQNSCPWEYKKLNCNYIPGPMFNVKDESTTDVSQDVCGKTLSACRIRFGLNAVLPYGGFPGARRNDQ